MTMIKYGTFVMFQNKSTSEIVEIALANKEELEKYAEDNQWREVGIPDDSEESSKTNSAREKKEEL